MSFVKATSVAVVLVGIAGCESSPPVAPAPTTAALTLSQPAAAVPRNTTLQLTASAQSTTGASTDVTGAASWSSSNETVATVASGVVSVKALGVAQITASYDGRTASTAVTARRRTHFNGTVTVRDVSAEASIGGLRLFLDEQEVMAIGTSGWVDTLSTTIRGSSAHKPITPGPQTFSILVEMKAGSHDAMARATTLTVYDSDTGEALTTLPLAQKSATIRSGERFSWTIDVPTFTE